MRNSHIVSDWIGALWGLAGGAWLAALVSVEGGVLADLIARDWTTACATMAMRLTAGNFVRTLVQLPAIAGLDAATYTVGLVMWALGASNDPGMGLVSVFSTAAPLGGLIFFAFAIGAGVLVTRVVVRLVRLCRPLARWSEPNS